MEILWGETDSLDQVAGCIAEAGPEQPWDSQQRSLQPAAAIHWCTTINPAKLNTAHYSNTPGSGK